MEAALFALVLMNTDKPFDCAATASGNYACSLGLTAMPLGPSELRYSNGWVVRRKDKGDLEFSTGLKSWIDITGAAQFENGVGLYREDDGRRFRASTGLYCSLVNPDLVRCRPPKKKPA